MGTSIVVQAWSQAGIKDFYISYDFQWAHKWPEYSAYFCHQGLEKICKAYVLAASKEAWCHLEEKAALEKTDRIARDLGHNLQILINCLRSRNVLPLINQHEQKTNGITYADEECINILQSSYIEARYPIPKSQKIYKRFPLPGKHQNIYSDPIKETTPLDFARRTALMILKQLEANFDVKLQCEENDRFSHIDSKDWKKFKRLFFNIDVPD